MILIKGTTSLHYNSKICPTDIPTVKNLVWPSSLVCLLNQQIQNTRNYHCHYCCFYKNRMVHIPNFYYYIF